MDRGISEQHVDTIRSIIQRLLCGRSCEIYLFGSRIVGEPDEGSELDILIEAEGEIDLATMALIEEGFDNSDLPDRVDLLDYDRTSSKFLSTIVPAARRVA